MRQHEEEHPQHFRGWVGFSIPVAHRIVAGVQEEAPPVVPSHDHHGRVALLHAEEPPKKNQRNVMHLALPSVLHTIRSYFGAMSITCQCPPRDNTLQLQGAISCLCPRALSPAA